MKLTLGAARLAAVLGALVVAPGSAAGQGAALRSAADSAAQARRAWAAAVDAYQRHDTVAARRAADLAARSWPTQPVYLWNSAVFAAMTGDTGAARRALESYARLGVGRDLAASPAMEPLRTAPWFPALAARHDANRAPVPRSRVRATLTDTALFPEGVAYDARSGDLFVASIRRRTIFRVDDRGTARPLWKSGMPGVGSVMAVAVEPGGAYLWATLAGLPYMDGYAPADSGIAALIRVRLADGEIVRRFDLPAGTPHILGDIVFGPHGDVFASDSRDPALYRLRPGADSLEALRHPLFRSLQGVAPAPDGRTVYVADYAHGILRVDLTSGEAIRLRDADHSTSLGCDGLVWYDGSLIAIQNGVSPARVMRFRLDSAGTAIVQAEVIDRHASIADAPTIGTVAGEEFVYVANSQWDLYDDAGSLRPDAVLRPPVLLALPLK